MVAVDNFLVLVQGLIQGSSQSAVEAFRRFAPVVNRVLRRMLGTGEVEDLVQEVFLHLFRRIGDLRDPQALPAFVVAFATRTAQWEMRKRSLRRFIQLTPSGEQPDQVTDETDWESRRAVASFYAILSDLRSTDRAAFVLRFVEKMEMKDVAFALGVSESTAKRRTSLAWQRVIARAKKDPALVKYARDAGIGALEERREEGPHV